MREFGADCEVFQYYNWKTGQWIHASSSSPRFAINDARDVLFRSKGVERGVDMPTRSVRDYALPLYVTHAR